MPFYTLAIAKAAGLDFTLDDFQAIMDKTPFLADLKPSGKYLMEDSTMLVVTLPY